MLKKSTALLLSLALSLNVIATPASTFAADSVTRAVVKAPASTVTTTESKTGLHTPYGSAYDTMFKVDRSKVKGFTNNGGQYSSSSLDKAFDNTFTTHWETGKPNSATFTNEVVIELTELTVLDRIVYAARQDVSKGKGFAKRFEIHGSTTSTGDDFTLIATGSYKGSVGDIVEIAFQPSSVKRLKFKFIEAHNDWASASEFMLYKEDKVRNDVLNMFTDGLQMALKSGYTRKKITDLERQVATHPLKAELEPYVVNARNILNNAVNFTGTYWDLERRGNSIQASQLRKVWNFQDWQPTGYRVKPGDVINVYVDAVNGEPMPSLVFKQMDTAHLGTVTLPLQYGRNTITIPAVETDSIRPGKAPGGVLYTVNPYTSTEQSRQPKIRFENLKPYPHYVKGVDTDEAVLRDLETYVQALAQDSTLPDVFEVFGDKSLVNVTATAAYNFYKTSGKTPSSTANVQDDIIAKTMAFWGFDGSSPLHSDFNFRYVNMLKNLSGGAYMNASNGVTGMRPEHEVGALEGETGWGFMHELGHNFDTRNRLIVEVTNNILPLQFQRLRNVASRLTTSGIYETLVYPKVIKEDYVNNTMYPEGDYMNFQHIAALWQIALYDEAFYPAFEKKFRETNEQYGSITEVHNAWAKIGSDVLGMDLSEHFERHGAKLTEATKLYTSKYPKSAQKTWYLNDSRYLKGGGAFTQDMTYALGMERSANGNTIRMNVDPDNQKHVLGYEVYRDGVLIGFTEKNTFLDTGANAATNHEYKVVAFDQTLTGKGSATIKAFTPNIQSIEKVTLGLGETFNPIDYVKALNYEGTDITANIRVDHNVNTALKGNYTITYTVTDQDATVVKTLPVEVVSKYDYLSDFKWQSVETQYGTPRSNQNIKARVNGDIKTFDKGIGLHANGKVVYNIDGLGYERFEALLGVDMNLAAQTYSSVNFRILGDGVELASTKVFKHADNAMYVSVPVAGVKTLTIEVLDGGNGNGSDHGIIVNPKLTTNNARPVLDIPSGQSTELGVPITDLAGTFRAFDAEDGDLTNRVVVTHNVDFNKAGVYEVTYTVTDTNGNTTTKKRSIKVIDMNAFRYMSDIAWKSAVNTYGQATKDLSVSGNTLRLTGADGQVVSYSKGIGTHSTSTIIYDLTGTTYGYFTSFVGVDRQMYGTVGSVNFQVYLDGALVYETGRMNSTDPQRLIEVNLGDAKELKLVVTDAGNGNGSDHATFGDAKLYYAGATVIN